MRLSSPSSRSSTANGSAWLERRRVPCCRATSAATRQACFDEARATFDANAPKAEVRAFYRACLARSRGDVAAAAPGSSVGCRRRFRDASRDRGGSSAVERLEAFDFNVFKGCAIVADDGEFLDLVADRFATRSIMNRLVSNGSEYQAASIFNEYGQNGGEHSATGGSSKATKRV